MKTMKLWLYFCVVLCHVWHSEEQRAAEHRVIAANGLVQAGRWREAANIYQDVISGKHGKVTVASDRAKVLANLAIALRDGREWVGAFAASKRVGEEDPLFPEGPLGEGQALREMGMHEQAAARFERAARLFKDQEDHEGAAQARLAAAQCMVRAGKLDRARKVLLKLVGYKNVPADSRARAAALLRGLGGVPEDKLRAVQRVRGVEHWAAEAALLLFEGFMQHHMYKDAALAVLAAIEHHPDNFLLRSAVALAYDMSGQHAHAITHLEAALRVQPHDAVSLARLLHAKASLVDWQGRHELLGAFKESLARGWDCASGSKGDCIEPLVALYIPLSAEETQGISHRACMTVQMGARAALHVPFGHVTTARSGRVRVGYLTSDVRSHATAYLARSLMGLHDRERIEVWLYMTIIPPSKDSGYYKHMSSSAEHFAVVADLSDFEMARRINADHIEVLIDVNGWVKGERSTVLAMKPASTQVHYMAYLHNMACPFLDFMTSDPIVSNVASLTPHHEKLIILPASFLINDHKQTTPHSPAHTKETLNMTHTSGPLLGNFNAMHKMDPESVAVWVQALQLAPHASLWLQMWDKDGAANFRRNAEQLGIPRDKIHFTNKLPAVYGEVWNAHASLLDVHIDTLTYNAVTLGADLLWEGVPALTTPGQRMCARVGASLATAAGVGELIARTPDDMAQLAALLLLHSQRRQRLRAKILSQKAKSDLYDTTRWVRRWERALRAIRELDGSKPRPHIIVAASP